ncbi:MAG: hypothetical protein HOO67_00150, partial [Candidatus Peribacteraceae bacterium]|nr:hypothetical protein [Candidatus Peribacteraceae bacterium]
LSHYQVYPKYQARAIKSGIPQLANDSEAKRWILEQYSKDQQLSSGWAAFQWREKDNHAQEAEQKRNPKGNIAEWKKGYINAKMQKVTDDVFENAQPYIEASERWREENGHKLIRPFPPLRRGDPPRKKMNPEKSSGTQMRDLFAGEERSIPTLSAKHTNAAKIALKK